MKYIVSDNLKRQHAYIPRNPLEFLQPMTAATVDLRPHTDLIAIGLAIAEEVIPAHIEPIDCESCDGYGDSTDADLYVTDCEECDGTGESRKEAFNLFTFLEALSSALDSADEFNNPLDGFGLDPTTVARFIWAHLQLSSGQRPYPNEFRGMVVYG